MSSKAYRPRKKKDQLIIGVCGPSTSGKSTIINKLFTRYDGNSSQMSIIPMERFFIRYNPPVTRVFGQNFTNLDLQESIDWDSFYREIDQNNSPILFIDGFILFADQRSYDLVDVCIAIEYNIKTDFDIALDRRIHRNPLRKNAIIEYDYLQNPFKNRTNRHCTYFHEIVWPEMVKHPEYRKPQNWEKPLLTLSATNDLKENVSKSLNFLQPFVNSYLQ